MKPTGTRQAGPPAFLRRMEAIAAIIDARTLEGELGAMCQRSLFFDIRSGRTVTQSDIDDASRAFLSAVERLMPPGVLHGFLEHACASRILPQIDRAELVPGFTDDEALAGTDASARAASPMKKFTRTEVLECLAWNREVPVVPVALAHLVDLVQTYAAALQDLVARRSPEAARALAPFVAQWSPKNVLKFVNVALFVAGRRRHGASPILVDQPLVVDAMTLLNHSGAFTWNSREDSAVSSGVALRIHCPAQAFLHRLLANEGSLVTLLAFIDSERVREPVADEVSASLAFIREAAAREDAGIRTFGQEWSQMKLDAGRG